MKTNKFHIRLLSILGANLSPNAKPSSKVISWALSLGIFLYYFCFGFIATVWYMHEHWNDLIEVLNTTYLMSAILSGMFAFINLTFQKKSVNKYFSHIEFIVDQRRKLVDNDLYGNTVEIAEKFVKYPLLFFSGATIMNSFGAMIYNVISDFIVGEFHIEKWFLPFQYK